MPAFVDHRKFPKAVHLIVVPQKTIQGIVIRNAHGNVKVQSATRSVSQSVRLRSARPDAKALTHLVAVWSVMSRNVQWFAPRERVRLAVAQLVRQHAVNLSAN